MKEFFIGEILRNRRIELGLTQEQVCEGIFNEPSTLSRIENGVHVPTRRKLIVLLQRLGLPGDRYYALVDKNELEISELQSQIIFCKVRSNFQEGLEKLTRYEEITSPNDILAKQFLLSSRAILGKWENGKHIPYSFEEKLDTLFKAIYLTVPYFNIDKIDDGLYGIDEIKIMNQIALTYSNALQRNLSIKIYCQLLAYINDHLHELNQTMPITILISYNYARDLCLEGQFDKAFDIAESGLQTSIETGRSICLGGLHYILARCYYNSGQNKTSLEHFRQSYYVYLATQDIKNASLVKDDIKDFFNESP